MSESDRLSDIRKRREAATPGPWRMTTQGGVESVHYRGPGEDFTSVAATRTPGDWEFIANAPADIDWLIERYAALRSKLAEVREEIERSKWRFDHEYGSHFVTDADDLLAILDREEADRG